MYDDDLKTAVSHPIDGLFVKIPKTSPPIFQPVDGAGQILYTENLIVHSLFTKEISPALAVDQKVRGMFLMRDDIWLLSFKEKSEPVSLLCRNEDDYSFSIEANESSQVTLRRNTDNEMLHVAPLEDFEGDDKSKLKLLNSAFHSKYQAELISAICLIPYKGRLIETLFGLCGARCIWNFQCSGSVDCTSCRWFDGFKCG